ncbi:hypothetical protein BGZ58_006984 [Dissophora ornata]|nr:hypothetical protein BGZ58_006984 [Dissophora ornata]
MSMPSQGIPFSNMLDLATAKAENITGLYYAKQMNRKSASFYALKDPLNTPAADYLTALTSSESEVQSLLSSPGQHERQPLDASQDSAHIRIEVDAPTPVMTRTSYLATTENARVASLPHNHSAFSPTAKRSRTLTSAEPVGSSLHSKTSMEVNFDPTSNAHSGDLPSPSHPPPSTPTRAQHRRSHSASHFFHLSSLKHHSPAQFNLALCYEHGQGGVDKDLERAMYFYQQAADQGHTKASYNIGCICYNEGEVSKAMAWFESAGKCSIRGLRMEATEQPAPGCNLSDPSSKYPIPRQTSLPHELEDMLLGNLSATSGPFAAYLPAILCLALLCRQGVQTRDGEVILKKDPEQSVELLQKVLDRASSQSHLGSDEDSPEPRNTHQGTLRDRASVTGDGFGGASLGRRHPIPQDTSIQTVQTHGASLFSTSCPSLPLGNRSNGRPKDASSDLPVSSASQPSHERAKRRSTVEDEIDVDMPQTRGFPCTQAQEMRKERMLDRPLDMNGSDDHETWSVILTRQLLKVWKPSKSTATTTVSTATTTVSTDLSGEAERKSKRILRHHLLYITNPTLGKNLYNLGVLYDLYLGNAVIAIRCYRAAYQNSLSQTAQDSSTESLLQQGSDSQQEMLQQELEQRGLVTRINSAWNLGVLHVRRKEWKLAQEWFVRAQRDVLLHERRQQRDKEHCDAERGSKGGETGGAQYKQDPIDTASRMSGSCRVANPERRSLVNVVPHSGSALPLDSPGKRHAHEHGLMMHLGAMADSGSGAGAGVGVNKKSSKAGAQQSADRTGGLRGREDLPEDGIRTDASKVSWVMRWVESQMEA